MPLSLCSTKAIVVIFIDRQPFKPFIFLHKPTSTVLAFPHQSNSIAFCVLVQLTPYKWVTMSTDYQ